MVLGIVAEYNPFHNGHLYHLLKSKEKSKADKVIAIIGGNFTQRGETSIIDKWSKAEMAIKNGADLVIELPTIYSVSSAENFADGAIKILNSLKIVDTISFGTETQDLNKLNIVANILYNEPKEYKDFLQESLQNGKSYPRSREEAILKYLNDKSYSTIISSPNNILGIEYLKAIKKHRAKINPICIKRKDAGHLTLDYTGKIASATAIREMIRYNKMKEVKNTTTPASYTILTEEMKNGHFIYDISQFENIMLYNLRNMSIQEIANMPDVTEGMEHLIKKAANSCNTIDEFVNIVSSKRYTNTRIKRILIYSLLKITKKDMAISKKYNPYIRVLGFNQKGKEMISEIKKKNPKANVVTSVKKFMDNNTNKNLKIMMEKDILATNIYTLGYGKDSWSNLDYTKKMVTNHH
mgnify:CR=1 FL=1